MGVRGKRIWKPICTAKIPASRGGGEEGLRIVAVGGRRGGQAEGKRKGKGKESIDWISKMCYRAQQITHVYVF